MSTRTRVQFIRFVVLFAVLGLSFTSRPASAADAPQGRGRAPRRVEGYYKGRITPHWFGDNTCLWYRNDLSEDRRQFVLVNVKKGTRREAFDHARLAAALSEAAGAEYEADRLPFDNIEFADGAASVRFEAGEAAWLCDLSSYICSKTDVAPSDPADEQESRSGRQRESSRRRDRSPESPDGQWMALLKDGNVFLRAKGSDDEIQLSVDGAEGNAYGLLSWAPDSQTLVAFRIEP
jgi:hypothetical protein